MDYILLKRFFVGTFLSIIIVFSIAIYAEKGPSLNFELYTSQVTTERIELDFTEMSSAHYDFDNNFIGPFNHSEVEITYTADPDSIISIELFVDKMNNSSYESCATSKRGYLLEFEAGTSALMELPYGSSPKNYRLVITSIIPPAEPAFLSVNTTY